MLSNIFSKTLISLISILQAVKSGIKNTWKNPGPSTEIYGPRSEYGFLQTAHSPIRMQDSCTLGIKCREFGQLECPHFSDMARIFLGVW